MGRNLKLATYLCLLPEFCNTWNFTFSHTINLRRVRLKQISLDFNYLVKADFGPAMLLFLPLLFSMFYPSASVSTVSGRMNTLRSLCYLQTCCWRNRSQFSPYHTMFAKVRVCVVVPSSCRITVKVFCTKRGIGSFWRTIGLGIQTYFNSSFSYSNIKQTTASLTEPEMSIALLPTRYLVTHIFSAFESW
jgi:hypothetical protein